jgi:hypothetical protein
MPIGVPPGKSKKRLGKRFPSCGHNPTRPAPRNLPNLDFVALSPTLFTTTTRYTTPHTPVYIAFASGSSRVLVLQARLATFYNRLTSVVVLRDRPVFG